MSWISKRDGDLLIQAQNIYTLVQEFAADLNVTSDQIEILSDVYSAFDAALNAKASAEHAYRESVNAAEQARAGVVFQLSTLNQYVRTQPGASMSVIEKAGFPVYRRPSRGAPITPVGLTAQVLGQQSVFLKWKRAGNPRSAVFIIEAKFGTGAWEVVGSTTGTRTTYETSQPGVPTQFRVTAQRGAVLSSPSVSASVWPQAGQTVSLKLAA